MNNNELILLHKQNFKTAFTLQVC